MVVLDDDLRVVSASRSFFQTFKVSRQETVGRLIYDIGKRQWDLPKLRELLEEILPKRNTFDDYEIEHDFEHMGKRKLYLNARRLYSKKNRTQLILLAFEDLTDRKQGLVALQESEKKYQDLYDNAPDMFVSVDAKTATIINCNQTVADQLGYTKEEIIGRPIFDMYTQDSTEYAKKKVFPLFVKTGEIKDEELQLQRKDKSRLDVSLNVSAVFDENGDIIHSRSVWRDITKRKQAEKERDELINELQDALKEIKILKGILPFCSFCKKIRDDKGYWEKVDVYINRYSQADISHSVCPDCAKKYYPDIDV